VADSGNHSGYKRSSAHLAGEPVALRVKDARGRSRVVQREAVGRGGELKRPGADSKWFGKRRAV